jgi:SAM-dependent methyltransferase
MNNDVNLLGDIDNLYEEEYFQSYLSGTDDPLYKKRLEMYSQEIARILKFKESGSILDYGCGTGEFLSGFDGKKWKKYGIEVSKFATKIAKESGIEFDFDKSANSIFDIVVFRGTIQHIDNPILAIQESIKWLKDDGVLIFLATPNTGSLYYRIFQTLPMIDPKYNYILVSDKILQQILNNLGLSVIEFIHPYMGTPYEKWPIDLIKFLLKLFGFNYKFAFWGNVLECYAKKKDK